ncbi:MAG: phenylacetate-CoA oxygenase subunit PaaJ [Actinomycetota bacterium]|nr:phenylacetate-CoA oxygenase subunit PaaJ [Actinomycetota bacterium]MDQ3342673.1 phenylacetate-CoA oxygenase subunit PaaJ [Actinomycetota bacterium]
MSAATGVTSDDVRAVLDTVPDPEMPPVSVAELGMVTDVRVHGDRVEVDLVPTYSGCPATAVIREETARAVQGMDGVGSVEVRFVNTVVWEPERITAPGRRKLAEFGIAPPGSGQALLQIGRRPGLRNLGEAQGVVCPLCGSRDTVADSPFGPTPCRSSSYCNACRNPFEVIKP